MSTPTTTPSDGLLAREAHAVTSVGAMIAATRVRRPVLRDAFPVAAPPGDTSRAISLGDPRALARPLIEVVTTRRSGGIMPGSVDQATFAALVAASGSPAGQRLVPSEELQPLIFPVVLDVDGIPAGAYRYVVGERALVPVAEVARAKLQEDMLLQWEHGEGAAIVFLAVPLAAWLHRRGDRGYRSAALSVGFVSDRLYLAAEALGLSYTSTGGFAPRVVDQLLGLDGHHLTSFFSFAIGAARRGAR